jgi:hypothetical protein
MADLDPKLKALIDKVTDKRPRTVLDLILKHGFVTTEQLAIEGYTHGPRAARDVREQGIPLETFKVKSSTGRSIAAYRFGDPSQVKSHKLGGRSVLPEALRDKLFLSGGGRCFVCGHSYEKRYFQVDHRVPYEITGEIADPSETGSFMLLCASCQRSKSWSCEHCSNWQTLDETVCGGCYWAVPESYSHVATEEVRRVDLVFAKDETTTFDSVSKALESRGTTVREALRQALLQLAAMSVTPPDKK